MTYGEREKQLPLLSDKALLETLSRCEEAVVRGTAQMGDYQRFVVCAEELTRRRTQQELCA